MRTTGIDVIGDVPWGTHCCQFYQDKQDLIDILVPYFAAGLAQHEYCLWVTSDPLSVDDATAALTSAIGNLDDYFHNGQLEILDYRQWYQLDGIFDADRVLQGWIAKLAAARERGFVGLRLTGNTSWLEQSAWREFTEYEAMVDEVIGRHPMLAICTYSLEKCGAAEIMDVVSNHAFALIKRAGRWQIIESAERKQQAEQLRKLNRTYRAISNSNQAMMHCTDEAALLDEVCRIIVRDCGHKMVWIGYAEDDAARTVRPVAAAGLDEGYLDTLQVTWADTERGRGPTGTAIRTRRPAVCCDMLTDPLFAPWREQAIKRGYASSIALPLPAAGNMLGAVTIYSPEPDAFTEDEVALLSELAADLAYGIDAIRLRAAHARAEAAPGANQCRHRYPRGPCARGSRVI